MARTTLAHSIRCCLLCSPLPSEKVTQKPTLSLATASTAQPHLTRTPDRPAARSSASMIVAERSETGKTRPSASTLRSTPSAENHACVSSGPNCALNGDSSSRPPRGYPLHVHAMGEEYHYVDTRVLELAYLDMSGAPLSGSCMTLQRPPPETSTFCSGALPASSSTTSTMQG